MKLIIFDMDGVIFDSEQAVFDGWKELSIKYGFENLEIPYKKCIGVNAVKAREIFLDYYGEDFPYDEYCAEQSRNYHAKYDGGRLPLKPGIKELLKALRAKDYKIAVASSTRVGLVKQQIEDAGLAEFFDVYVGGDMVERSKPNPDIFVEAANRLSDGTDNKDIFVIEDSYNGIRAAHAAGMRPVMVPDMVEPNDEMREKAEFIKDSLEDVIAIV